MQVYCPECKKQTDARCHATRGVHAHDIKRRYECNNCGTRFTRYEVSQQRYDAIAKILPALSEMNSRVFKLIYRNDPSHD